MDAGKFRLNIFDISVMEFGWSFWYGLGVFCAIQFSIIIFVYLFVLSLSRRPNSAVPPKLEVLPYLHRTLEYRRHGHDATVSVHD